ncbi:MAG: InlB B-repeat-containing protein, partial [Firmicutes bacterium]|nr:InlB B-repeat-containing protein [Bacillota bacterium]
TREGYTFAGWYYGIYAYTFTGAVTFDFTLTARWTRITYKVTFDSNGGTPVAARTVAYGAAAAKPSNPSRAGSNFLGWTLDGAAYDFAAPVYSDITLTAVWETKTLTVTFDSAGGSPVPSQGVLYGSQAVKPANPTRDGYNFAGWYYGIFAYTFTGPVTFDFTLTARWQQITYKVTFDSNGGSAVPSRTVYSGNPVSKPADPVRTGYTFNGWYLDGAPYDFSAPVAGDLALKAGWDIRNYMVTFDSAGGSPVAAVTATYGSQLQKPADPVREGYTFTGWYAAYALAPYSFTGPVTSSFTLTARWKQITYTVRFDSAGGSAVLARTVVYNELKTSAKRPMFYRAKFEARFQTKRL